VTPGVTALAPIGRRDFMARSGTALALAGAGWPAAVKASDPPRLMIVSLDGGADGLALLPPHGDSRYHSVRGPLALESAELSLHATDCDGFFALHPAMAGLRAFYRRVNFWRYRRRVSDNR
jgi:uncharacterized protein (DUF1501 family)